MATKKQVRARLEEKRRIDAAESRRTGLLAQERDRQHREAIRREEQAAANRKKSNAQAMSNVAAAK